MTNSPTRLSPEATAMMMRLTLLLSVWAGCAASATAQPILVLIGGNHSDPSPEQLAGRSGRGGNSGLWRLKNDLLAHEHWEAEYFNWNGTPAGGIDDPAPGGARKISAWIRTQRDKRPDAPIVLVGNSWGGHTAWQVCRLLAGESVDEPAGTQHSIGGSARSGKDNVDATESPQPASNGPSDLSTAPTADANAATISVELVIFLDPSSFGRGKEPMPTALPGNVERAVNYFTHNSFGWSEWMKDPRLTNVDLGDPAEGFLVPNGPRYDSRLDLRAHVAAEWDERIHAAMRKEIVAAVGSPANVGSPSTGHE